MISRMPIKLDPTCLPSKAFVQNKKGLFFVKGSMLLASWGVNL